MKYSKIHSNFIVVYLPTDCSIHCLLLMYFQVMLCLSISKNFFSEARLKLYPPREEKNTHSSSIKPMVMLLITDTFSIYFHSCSIPWSSWSQQSISTLCLIDLVRIIGILSLNIRFCSENNRKTLNQNFLFKFNFPGFAFIISCLIFLSVLAIIASIIMLLGISGVKKLN